MATPSPELDQARRIGLIVFTVLIALEAVAIRRGHGHRLGLVAVAAGLATIGFAALGWGSDEVLAPVIGAQLLLLSAVTGGVLAAMILGHWYLVTPKLLEAPLILAVRLLLAALIVQLVAFVVAVAVGLGAEAPFAALTGPHALLVWLRLMSASSSRWCSRGWPGGRRRRRSMESATGLLYIELAACWRRTIVAAGLSSVGLRSWCVVGACA